jgi:hypothetical protein
MEEKEFWLKSLELTKFVTGRIILVALWADHDVLLFQPDFLQQGFKPRVWMEAFKIRMNFEKNQTVVPHLIGFLQPLKGLILLVKAYVDPKNADRMGMRA